MKRARPLARSGGASSETLEWCVSRVPVPKETIECVPWEAPLPVLEEAIRKSLKRSFIKRIPPLGGLEYSFIVKTNDVEIVAEAMVESVLKLLGTKPVGMNVAVKRMRYMFVEHVGRVNVVDVCVFSE